MYQYKPVATICQKKKVAMPQPQAQAAEQHASSMHCKCNRDQPNLPNFAYGTSVSKFIPRCF
jgi:hypothetical protein